MEKQTVIIAITADLDYSGLVRHVANEVFEHAHFSKAWCGRLKLVVDELFMNACRYGSIKGKSVVHLAFEYDDQGMRFTIEDDGTGPQAKSAEELKAVIQKNAASMDVTRTSGRGLALISKMWTDGMVVEKSQHGGILISFVKRLENAESPPLMAPMALEVITPEPLQVTVTPVPPPPTAKATPVVKGPVVEIKLSGEIDQSNLAERIAPIASQVEIMPNGGILALDFSELIYINSTFIGAMAGWYRSLLEKGGTIRIIKPSPQIKEILSLVGLLNVLEIQE